MKIRIKGNTVRYRLTKSEVIELAETGKLEERTEFLSSAIIYAIQQTDTEHFTADFVQNHIILKVPQILLQQWAATNQVGIEHHMPLPNGNSLYLLVEKDFKCIDADVSEDQSDYFENPQLTC